MCLQDFQSAVPAIGAFRPPKAAAKLLELLNRYSTEERKN
jgi:hypothetical protein